MRHIKTDIIIFLFIISTIAHAQSRKITLVVHNSPIKEVFAQIQQKSGYRILFNDEVVPDELKVTSNLKNIPVKDILEEILKNTGLGYVMNGNELIIITKEKYLQTTSDIFGKITDEKGEPLAFANMVILNANDTTKYIQGVATDLNGNYQLLRVKHGNYQLRVSYLGYLTRTEKVSLTDNKTLNYQLKPDAKTLKAVTVEGQTVRVTENKTIYQVLKADLPNKRNALDLMTKVPQISIDPVNEKIMSNNGKSVKLLLNGTNATEIDLKSIRPENVVRFEYYNIPPARYAEYGSVINVITKTPEDGVAAGVDVNHAFTTGFGNDMVYFKYNHGRNQIALDYSLYYRNYKQRKQEGILDYTFQGNHYRREKSLRNAFGYDDNHFNLTYSNQKNDDYAFQVKFSPNYNYYHNDGKSMVNYLKNSTGSTRKGTNKSRDGVFSPVMDIYFWKKLPKSQELAINVVGTAFNTSSIYTNNEFDDQNTLVLNDNMNEQNRKYSIISELNYAKQFKIGRFNSGYSLETNTMNTNIDNSFGLYDYNTSFQQHYVYTEFSGQKNKWQYLASLGLTYRNRKSYNNQYSGLIFRPQFSVGYAFNAVNNLKLIFQRNNQEPSLADLSNNRTYITDQIIRQGNPFLRNSIENGLYLEYNLNFKYLNFNVVPLYIFIEKPQNNYFVEKSDYIVQATENGINSKRYGFSYSGQIKPFGNNTLQINFWGEFVNTELNSSQIGHYEYLSKPFGYNISLNINDFSAYYMGKIIGYYLSGPYLTSDENAGHLGVRYAKNNWSVSAAAYWLGTMSKYHSYTIPESIVQSDFRTKIYDNASMIVLGFSYNFNKGKKYNEKQKTLQNSDKDAGVF